MNWSPLFPIFCTLLPETGVIFDEICNRISFTSPIYDQFVNSNSLSTLSQMSDDKSRLNDISHLLSLVADKIEFRFIPPEMTQTIISLGIDSDSDCFDEPDEFNEDELFRTLFENLLLSDQPDIITQTQHTLMELLPKNSAFNSVIFNIEAFAFEQFGSEETQLLALQILTQTSRGIVMMPLIPGLWDCVYGYAESHDEGVITIVCEFLETLADKLPSIDPKFVDICLHLAHEGAFKARRSAAVVMTTMLNSARAICLRQIESEPDQLQNDQPGTDTISLRGDDDHEERTVVTSDMTSLSPDTITIMIEAILPFLDDDEFAEAIFDMILKLVEVIGRHECFLNPSFEYMQTISQIAGANENPVNMKARAIYGILTNG